MSGQRQVSPYSESRIPTSRGTVRLRVYRDSDGSEPMAVIAGDVKPERTAVRIHSACFTSENLGSLKCDCREQLNFALEYISRECGVVVYLPQEGRGIGLGDKIRAYSLQEEGYDTLEANRRLGLPVDARTYESAALILRDLGIRSVRLITNNPRKIESLCGQGIQVVERIPVNIPANEHSCNYLATKYNLMGHFSAEGRHVQAATDNVRGKLRGLSRPLIHINCAVNESGGWCHSADATARFSCPVDWRRVHGLREQYDAVAVGGRTWILDKPRLTARAEHLGREPFRQPARVIFAGGQRWQERGAGELVVVTSACHAGADSARIVASAGRDLRDPLNALFDLGIRSMLVEGGPTLAGSFLAQGFADCITVFVRTECEYSAESAARVALPGLPSRVSVSRLGEGTLISHHRAATMANAASSRGI
jgi:GTP cyclohydrolase II